MRGSRAYVCARVRKRREGEKREEKEREEERKEGRKGEKVERGAKSRKEVKKERRDKDAVEEWSIRGRSCYTALRPRLRSSLHRAAHPRRANMPLASTVAHLPE